MSNAQMIDNRNAFATSAKTAKGQRHATLMRLYCAILMAVVCLLVPGFALADEVATPNQAGVPVADSYTSDTVAASQEEDRENFAIEASATSNEFENATEIAEFTETDASSKEIVAAGGSETESPHNTGSPEADSTETPEIDENAADSTDSGVSAIENTEVQPEIQVTEPADETTEEPTEAIADEPSENVKNEEANPANVNGNEQTNEQTAINSKDSYSYSDEATEYAADGINSVVVTDIVSNTLSQGSKAIANSDVVNPGFSVLNNASTDQVVSYTVSYITVDNEGVGEVYSTETFTAPQGTHVSADTTVQIPGYTYSSDYAGTILSGDVADGLVLRLFYVAAQVGVGDQGIAAGSYAKRNPRFILTASINDSELVPAAGTVTLDFDNPEGQAIFASDGTTLIGHDDTKTFSSAADLASYLHITTATKLQSGAIKRTGFNNNSWKYGSQTVAAMTPDSLFALAAKTSVTVAYGYTDQTFGVHFQAEGSSGTVSDLNGTSLRAAATAPAVPSPYTGKWAYLLRATGFAGQTVNAGVVYDSTTKQPVSGATVVAPGLYAASTTAAGGVGAMLSLWGLDRYINLQGANVYVWATNSAGTTTHTVTYANGNATGGTLPAAQTAAFSGSDALATNSMTRASDSSYSYAPNGWNTVADSFSSPGTHYADGAKPTLTGDITLYPDWTRTAVAPSATVTYHQGTGTGTVPAQQTVAAGGVTLATNSMTRASSAGSSYTVTYNYNGGSGTKTSDASAVTTSYTADGWATTESGARAYASGATYSGSSSIDLYPHFSESSSAAAVTLPTPAARSGYTFAGWAESASATTGVKGSYTPSGNVTLYAIWTAAAPSGSGTVTLDFDNPEGQAIFASDGTTLIGHDDTKTFSSAADLASYLHITTATKLQSGAIKRTGFNNNSWKYGSQTVAAMTPDSLFALAAKTSVTVAYGYTDQTFGVHFQAEGSSGTVSDLNGTSLRAAATAPAVPSPYTGKWAYLLRATGFAGQTVNAGVVYDSTTKQPVSGATVVAPGLYAASTTAAGGVGAMLSLWGLDRYINLQGANVYVWATNDPSAAVTYTIEYKANGGNDGASSMTPSSHTVGTPTALSTNVFAKKGYAFSGWNTATNGSGTYVAASATSAATDALISGGKVILYAQWTERADYKVAYDLDYTGAGTFTTDNSKKWSSTVSANPTGSNPTRTDGYGFQGWYTGRGGAGTKLDGTQTFGALKGTDSGDTLTVYAYWSALSSWTINYNANATDANGTVPTGASVYDGSSYTIPATTGTALTREGYTFAHWNEQANDAGASHNAGDSFTPTANTTLYAIWTPLPVTIKFDANTGTGTMTDITTDNGGARLEVGETAATFAANAFTKAGYKFDGWYEDAAATTPAGGYANSCATFVAKNSVASFAVSGSSATITLYAKWVPRSDYKVYFDANGGVSDTNKTNISWSMTDFTPGDTNNTSAKPTRTNYTFAGWNTTADGTGTTVNSSTVYNTIDSLVAVDGYVHVYAQWNEKMATITYMVIDTSTGATLSVNGTSGTTLTEQVGVVTGKHADGTSATGATVTIPAGYVYGGWFTDGGATTAAPNAYIAGNNIKPTAFADGDHYYLKVDPDNIGYTVEFYYEDGSNPGNYIHNASDNQTGSAAMGKTIQAQYSGSDYPNYANNGAKTGWSYTTTPGDPSITIGAIAVNNVLHIYYKCVPLTISYVWDTASAPAGATYPTSPLSGNAGASITAPTPAAVHGYTFDYWTTDFDSNHYAAGATFTMPGSNVKLKGYWKKADFTVDWTTTAGATGGTLSDGTTTGASSFTETVQYLGKPTKNVTATPTDSANYYFVNWSYAMDKDGDGTKETTGSVAEPRTVLIEGNTTFTAVWKTTMVIAYDPNGHGSWNLSDTTKSDLGTSDTIPAFGSFTATSGKQPSDSDMHEAGYNFLGWKWTIAGTNYQNYGSGATALPTGNVTTSITFAAQWEPSTQTITFVHTQKDGSAFTPAASWNTGADKTLSDTTGNPVNFSVYNGDITRAGFTINHWEDASGNSYSGSMPMPATNLTLYPVWDFTPVTITYVVNPTGAGNTGSVTTETLSSETATPTCTTATASTGWHFVEWRDASGNALTGAWVSGTNNATIMPQKDATDNVYKTATYTAYFEKDKFTVTYVDGLHGTVSPKTESVAYLGNPTGASVTPATGWVHAGWHYVIKHADGTPDTVGDSTSTTYPTSVTIDGDAEFTALYDAGTGYTVKYDSKGGSAIGNRTVGFDDAPITPTVSNPTRKGYTFSGWYWTSAYTAGTDVTSGTSGTKFSTVYAIQDPSATGSSITLYAKWDEKKTFTVVYDLDGGASPTGNLSTFQNLNPVGWEQQNLLPGENPVKAGYTFVGWRDSNVWSGANAVSNTTHYYDLAGGNDADNSSVTIYAYFTENIYKLNYDVDGGTAIPQKTGIKWGDVSLTVTPTKTGYTFQKWIYTNAAGVTLGDADSSTPFSTIFADRTGDESTIKAIWKQNGKYVVEYWIVPANGGTPTKDHASTAVETSSYDATNGTGAHTVYASNSPVNPENKDYRTETITGYYFNSGDSRNVMKIDILAGSTVALKLYYAENSSYQVGYDLKGGSIAAGDPVTAFDTLTGVYWTQDNFVPTYKPVKSGYKFVKWTYGTIDPVSGTTKYSDLAGTDDTSTSPRLLVAQWDTDTVTIKYTPSSSTQGSTYVTTEDVNAISGQHTDGSAISGSTPTPATGYKFTGWTYTDGAGTHNVSASWVDPSTNKLTPQLEGGVYVAREYIANFAPLSSVTYKVVHFKEQLDGSYKLTYVGGVLDTTKADDVDTIPAKEGTQTGSVTPKTYVGFTYNPSITGNDAGPYTVASDGSTVLILLYERNTHNVAYVYTNAPTPAGAPALPTGAANQKFGSSQTISAPAPTMNNWNFSGWTAYAKNPITGLYTDPVTVVAGAFDMPDADVQIKGTWTHKSYPVTFTSDTGGTVTGSGTSQNVEFDDYPVMTNVSRSASTGYYFVGWTYDMDTDDDGVVDSTGNTTNNPANVPIKGITTFTAKWAKSFSVSYLRGTQGTFTVANEGYTQFSNLAKNATWPLYNGEVDGTDPAHNTGYKFLGWMWTDGSVDHYIYNDASDVPAGYTNETYPVDVDKDYTLTAMWEGLPFTITWSSTDRAGNTSTWADSGTDVSHAQIHNTGSTVTMYGAGSLVRAGYTLSGWEWQKDDGTWTFYPESDTSFVMPGNNTTVYAKWDFTPVTITYVASPAGNGTVGVIGAPTTTSETLSSSTATPAGAKATANTGYAFDHWEDAVGNPITATGWLSDTDGDGKFETLIPGTETDGSYKSTTYTAIFTAGQVTYTIEYWLGDATNSSYSHNTTVKPDETNNGTTGNPVSLGTPPSIPGFTYIANADVDNDGTIDEILSDTVKADSSTVLRVYYERDQRTLTYVFAGDVPPAAAYRGTGNANVNSYLPASANAGVNTTQTVPTGFENDYNGYVFIGWTTSDSGTTVAADGTFTMPDANLTVTGTWEAKHEDKGVNYTVVYVENNGASDTDVDDLPNTVVTSVTWITSGLGTTYVSGVAGTPTKAGYTFGGWYKDAALTQALGTGDTYGDIAVNDTVTSISLYAKWNVAGDFIIHYLDDPTAGTPTNVAADRTSMSWTATGLAPLTAPTKTGYHLGGTAGYGWAYYNGTTLVNINASTSYEDAYNNGQGTGKELNLYVVWVGNSYKIHFDNNDASYPSWNAATGTMADQNMTYGTPANLDANQFAREGYRFGAWNTQADGLGTAYADMQSVQDLVSTDNGTITLYAQWIRKSQNSAGDKYKVVYEEEGGTPLVADQPDMTNITVVNWETSGFDTTYNPLTWVTVTPSRTGYTFGGWYTDKTTWSHQVVAVDTFGYLNYLQNGTADDEVATVTLYAKWDESDGFAVIYEENNGAGDTDVDDLPNTVVTNVKWTTSGFDTTYVAGVAGQPTKNGYDFAGWYKDSALTNALATGDTYGDLVGATGATSYTLYAKWTPKHEDKGVQYFVVYEENNNSTDSDVYDQPDGGNMTEVNWETANLDVTYTGLGVTGNPTKAGYTFVGWFKDSALTQALGTGDTYGDIAVNDTVTTITLYAKWNENSDYIIHYDVNGGDASSKPADRTGVSWSTTDLKPATNPTYAGKQLDGYGWAYKKADGTFVAITAGTPYSDAWTYGQGTGKEVTLYAQWKDKTYTIHYDANGGAYADLTTDKSQVVSWPDMGFLSAVPETPTRTGYTLKTVGPWATTSAGGTALNDTMSYADLALNDDDTVDVYVYAQWEPIVYKVSFNGNGTTAVAMADQTFTYDVAADLDTNTYVRNGYDFAGWNTMADGTGAAYSDAQNVINLTSAQNGVIPLYAQWTPAAKGYKVLFDEKGGSAVADVTTGITWITGGFGDATTPVTTKTGYAFKGWFLDDVTFARALALADTYGDIVTFDGGDDDTLTATVYAKWEPITYKVSFDGNGTATVAMADQTMTYDVAANLAANTYDRNGYDFAGWNTKADGTGTAYADAQNVVNLSSVQDDVVALFAQWTAKGKDSDGNLYKVVYEENNGATDTDVLDTDAAGITVLWTTSGFATTYTAAGVAGNPTKAGYTFVGWYKDSALTSAYNNEDYGQLVTFNGGDDEMESVTLYAKWDPIKYSLHYISNGGTYADGSIDKTVTVEWSDDTFLSGVPEVPTRTGYTLAAAPATWDTQADGLGTDLDDVLTYAVLAGNDPTRMDVYVYAQWKPVTYVVRFDANDAVYPTAEAATGTMADQTMTYDVAADLYANAFARRGYTYRGWNTKADGTGTSYADTQNVINLGSAQDEIVTLYAIWDEIDTYIVHYVDGMDLTTTVSPDKTDATWATTALYPATDPTKAGYKFDHWTYKDQAGTMHDVTVGTTAYSTLSDAIDPAVIQSEVTLYANWLKYVDYKVTYWTSDDNGVTLVQDTSFIGNGNDLEGTVVTPDTLADGVNSWKGIHHIAGYFYDAAATNAYGIGSITLDPTRTDQELKLVFLRKSDYILVYDPNYTDGGVAAPKDTENAYWNETGLDAHGAARRGYTLEGWYLEAAGTTKVATADAYGNLVVIQNPGVSDTDQTTLTLYAKWTPKSNYKVKYDLNYGQDEDGNPIAAKHQPATVRTPADKLKVSWTQSGLEPTGATYDAPTGYEQDGWYYLDRDGNKHDVAADTEYSTISDAIDNTVAQDEVTLHAKWVEKVLQLHYVPAVYDETTGKATVSAAPGTVSVSDETLKAISGVAAGSVATAKPGWHFVAWQRVLVNVKTGDVFAVTVNSDGSMTLSAASASGQNVLPADLTVKGLTPAQNATDGIWYEETYLAMFAQNDPATLIYDKNADDATGTIADVVEPYGSLLTLDSGNNDIETPDDATDGFRRDHYDLIGWNTKADLSGTHYDLSTKDWELPEGTTTLYAEWSLHKGRLIYDKNADDAYGTIADVVKPYGTAITLDSGTEDTTTDTTDGFHRPHYVLVGWNTKADYTGTHYDLSTAGWPMPDGTTTLYAEWQKAKYEISGPEGTKTTLPEGGGGTKTDGGYITGGDVTKIEYGDPVPEGWIDAIPEAGKHVDHWTYTWTDEDGTVHTETADDPTKFTIKGKGTITAVFVDDPVEEPETPKTPAAATTTAAAHAAAGETIPQTSDTFDAVLPLTVAGLGLFLILLAFVARRHDDEDDADA